MIRIRPAISRRTALLLLSAAALKAHASDDTIRWVVGSGAGGALDTLGRLLGAEAAKTLGTSIVIENKPGNSGIASAAEVAHAAGDGRTYLFTTIGPLVNNVAVFTKLPYKPTWGLCEVISARGLSAVLLAPVPSNGLCEVLAQSC